MSRVRPGRARAVVVALAAAMALSACGSSPGSAPASSDPAGEPNLDAGATFAYAVGPTTLDPAKSTQRGGPDIYLQPIYDRLLRTDANFEIQPMLAQTWEFAPDGSTLTLKLRADATFADGSPVDAAAVKANLDRTRSLPGATNAAGLAPIRNITATDATTVVTDLAPGTGAALPALLAETPGMMMNPKAFADPNADFTNSIPVGTESGPFTVTDVSIGPGGRVDYQRRGDIASYWDKDAGRLAKLTWLNIPTAAQRINAVQAGDIDMGQVTGVDVIRAKQMVESGQLTGGYFTQPLIAQTMWINATRAPMDKLKLRQAIQASINREAMNTGLFGGNCTPANQDYPPGKHWAGNTSLPADEYNPDRARQLIAESGLGTPKFTLYALGETWKAQAEAVHQQLRDVGMDVTLEMATGTPGAPSFYTGAFDTQQGASLIGPDPSQAAAALYFGGANLVPRANRGEYQPLLDKLGDPRLSQDERAKVWGEISTKLHDMAYAVPVCTGSQVWLTDGSVGGVKDMPNTWIGLPDVRHLYIAKHN